jgi:membrane fusion protein (multidrug efflux system)
MTPFPAPLQRQGGRAHASLAAAIAALAGLILLVLAASCAKGPAGRPALAAPTPAPIPVRAAGVESRVLPRVLEVTGALTADETADVAAERDGRVARVLVERGTFVDKGAVLAELDDREARATLEQARANLAWADAEVARYAELRQKQVVAKAEDQRKGIDRDLARASRALAEKAFQDCVIRAPFAGLVTEKKISEGAFVKRGQPVAGLVKIEPLRAELSIPESAVGAVKVGQVVRLSVQSFPDRTFPGRIAYVGPSLRSEARTLVVEAHVPNPGRLLKPGLFATAAIELPTTVPTLLAPRAAVVTDAGVSRAFVLGEGRVSERLVSLGEQRGELVEIRSGLAAGDRVVLSPDRRLTDGLEIQR